MRIFVQSNDFKIWLAIKNGDSLPMKKIGDTLTPKDEDEYDEADFKKAQLNATTINFLYCAVNANDYQKISRCQTANQMWNKFMITYEEDMFGRFSNIVYDLDMLGKTLTDKELVRKILRSLTKEWESKVNSIYEGRDYNVITYDGVQAKDPLHGREMHVPRCMEVKAKLLDVISDVTSRDHPSPLEDVMDKLSLMEEHPSGGAMDIDAEEEMGYAGGGGGLDRGVGLGCDAASGSGSGILRRDGWGGIAIMGLSLLGAVLTSTSTTPISAATSLPSSKASAMSRVAITVAAAAVLSTIVAAAVCPTVELTAGSGSEQGRAAGVNGIGLLAIQEHESRSNLKKIWHRILKLHERGLSLKICGKPSEHLEDQLVLRDWCIDVIQPVCKVLELLAIGRHGGRALDGGAEFMF
ncbi:unnamed protein product [Cuscuta campestris]|uniref:UBN2 domain-containing protein n=1 Tax=Cuscuta campestris TaxID=132261 RepID=A0A484N385_9ASTE|nr:unnamed protein product [Cuscuta campestris]